MTEVAEQLKVDITSQMVNTRKETNLDYNEFFESVKEVRVSANLDYIEYVDTYQGNRYHYTLSRLNKEKYYQQLNMKKGIAATKAKNLIDMSINEMSANSLSNISIAIESIFPFLDYFPKIQNPLKNGEEEFVMNVAEQMVRMYNDDLEVSFSPKIVNAKAFLDNNKKVTIKVKSKSDIASVSNLRLLIRLNDENNNEFIMLDKNGKAEYKLGRLEVPSGNHSLMFSLDYQSMMTEKALELVNVIPREYYMDISLEVPKIYFDGNVSNLGNKVKNSPIYSSLKECLEDNYSSVFVNSKSKADILLNLEVMTEERAARLGENFPYFIYSVGSISMKNQKTKEEILNSRFKDMKGADFSSKEKAGMNALKKLSQNMNIDICD